MPAESCRPNMHGSSVPWAIEFGPAAAVSQGLHVRRFDMLENTLPLALKSFLYCALLNR